MQACAHSHTYTQIHTQPNISLWLATSSFVLHVSQVGWKQADMCWELILTWCFTELSGSSTNGFTLCPPHSHLPTISSPGPKHSLIKDTKNRGIRREAHWHSPCQHHYSPISVICRSKSPWNLVLLGRKVLLIVDKPGRIYLNQLINSTSPILELMDNLYLLIWYTEKNTTSLCGIPAQNA